MQIIMMKRGGGLKGTRFLTVLLLVVLFLCGMVFFPRIWGMIHPTKGAPSHPVHLRIEKGLEAGRHCVVDVEVPEVVDAR